MSKKFYKSDNYSTDRSIPKSTFYYKRKKERSKILNKFNELFPEYRNERFNNHKENHDEFEVFIDNEDDNCEKDKFSSNESEVDSDEKDEFDESLIFDEDDGDNESKSLSDDEKVELINVCLLTLFFAGKMTITSMRLVIRLIKIISNIKIPEKFDQISKKILSLTQEKIMYEKKWFCSDCKQYFNLEHSKQRLCQNCNSR